MTIYTEEVGIYPYPLTIISDRYNGCYSGGLFLAFNMDSDIVPSKIHEGDKTCLFFWAETDILVGKGDTPEAAIADLVQKMQIKGINNEDNQEEKK